mmetsp:Transcript_77214/g.184883  ORF Transcript_77214/g.184883 Transcript_77214/m.184883 type:complete len:799 (+) Transcript_77214:48-2444(+)
MTDSEEIEERVLALIDLLKKKDDKKIKECGEEIADAASDNEPYFEPEQAVQMMSTWLDACIAKRDDEVLQVTATAIRWAKVEDGSEHPGMTEVLKKLLKALAAPGSKHLENMFLVRAQQVKWTGDLQMYPVLTELLMHDKTEVLHDALELITGCGFVQLMELSDEEAAAVLKMTLELAKHVKQLVKGYKPGDMTISKHLAQKLTYLKGLLQAANIFCAMLVMNTGFPKASAAIAAPSLILELKDALSELKPKPKEQDLKQQLSESLDACQNLIASMPKPAAGSSSDPAGDAKSYLKGLGSASDTKTLEGTLKMMMSNTDPKFLDVVLAKDSLQSVMATFKKVKKTEMDSIYLTFQAFLSFAVQNRPAALDPVAEEMIQLYMAGPVGFATPKTFVDACTEKSPALAKRIWAKVDMWSKSVKDSKGGPMYEANLYQMASALESMPRVLEGAELKALAGKVKDTAELGKGTSMDSALKCSALVSLKALVIKDKARLPSNVLRWVQELKEGDGSAREMATSLIDAYEGRSLEGAYEQIADMNSRFKEACGDMESLKKYVDDNMSEMKDFISTVAKKLPMPVRFSSEPRYVVKKAMLLHFKCEAPTATRFCVLPGSTFTTETMEWSRWLKMGLSAAKLGKSILSADAIADVPGVVDQVKGLFSLYNKDEGEDFMTFISEPFLTSQEQDKLLNQLRAASYFENFRYDSQTASWFCVNCHAIYTKAGSKRTAEGLEEAASHPDLEIPFPDLRFESGGGGLEGLEDRARNAAGAALEVKKTTAACCTLFGFSLCETETGDKDEIKT